jgi:hypothetical protein
MKKSVLLLVLSAVLFLGMPAVLLYLRETPLIALIIAAVLYIVGMVMIEVSSHLAIKETVNDLIDSYVDLAVELKRKVGFNKWNAEAVLVETSEEPYVGITPEGGVCTRYLLSDLVIVKASHATLYYKKCEFGAIFFGDEKKTALAAVR